MQFSFSKKYRFACKKCGSCCFQRTISISDKELDFLKKKIKTDAYKLCETYTFGPHIKFNDVSFATDNCVFLSNIEKDERNCKNYDSRFIQCIMYPLSFSAFPDGELLVNLCHCNGVSLEEGELVNEEFVGKIVDKVKSKDPFFLENWLEFYKELHNKTLLFYNVNEGVDFNSKRFFIKKITDWIVQDNSNKFTIDLRIKAVAEIVHEFMYSNMSQYYPNQILLKFSDVKQIISKIESELHHKMMYKCLKNKKKKQKEIKKIISLGTTQIFSEDKIKTYKTFEKIVFKSPTFKKIPIRVETLVRGKKFSNDANQTLNDYFKELTSRIGRGGFILTYPIFIMLEALFRYSQEILSHATAYSKDSKIIEKSHISDAIVFLDSKNRIQDILNEVSKIEN